MGREEAIADLNIIAAQGAKVIVIQSAGGILVKSIEEEIDKERSVATGYKLIFLAATYKNLGDADRALSLYCQAVAPVELSQDSPVKTVKAKALSGIAEI